MGGVYAFGTAMQAIDIPSVFHRVLQNQVVACIGTPQFDNRRL